MRNPAGIDSVQFPAKDGGDLSFLHDGNGGLGIQRGKRARRQIAAG